MIVNIKLSDDEKKTIIDAFHILMEYAKHTENAERVKTVSLVNRLSDFIDNAFYDQ